jgi:hypothetical protein
MLGGYLFGLACRDSLTFKLFSGRRELSGPEVGGPVSVDLLAALRTFVAWKTLRDGEIGSNDG